MLGVLYSNIDMPFILVRGNANSLTILCSKWESSFVGTNKQSYFSLFVNKVSIKFTQASWLNSLSNLSLVKCKVTFGWLPHTFCT